MEGLCDLSILKRNQTKVRQSMSVSVGQEGINITKTYSVEMHLYLFNGVGERGMKIKEIWDERS